MKSGNDIDFIYQFFKKNIAYSGALIFERSVSFLLLPLYTHVLLPSEYGIYAILLSFMAISTFIYGFGIENGLLKFSTEIDKISRLNGTTFWSMVGMAFFFSSLLYFLSEEVSLLLFQKNHFSMLIQLTAAILFCETICRYFSYAIVGTFRSKLYLVIGLFRGSLLIILNILFLVVLHFRIEGVLISHLIVSFLVAFLLLIFSKHKIRLQFDVSIFKKIIAFGFPMMLTSIFVTLIHFFDRFLVQFYYSPAEAGRYGAAYKIGLIQNVVISAFCMVAIPMSSKLFIGHTGKQSRFSKLMSLLIAILLSIFTFVALFINQIANLEIGGYSIINENYHTTLSLVPLILAGYLFYGLYINFSLTAYYREKTYFLTLIAAFTFFINVVLNVILIPIYASLGAAIATLISYIVMSILMILISKWLLEIHFNWIPIISLFIIGFGVVFIFPLLRLDSLLLKLCGYLILQLLVFIYLFRMGILHKKGLDRLTSRMG